jgi:hypothetical protein
MNIEAVRSTTVMTVPRLLATAVAGALCLILFLSSRQLGISWAAPLAAGSWLACCLIFIVTVLSTVGYTTTDRYMSHGRQIVGPYSGHFISKYFILKEVVR